ncbi:CSN-associated deubiquitinating enzyme Ubp12 [Blyttiomyces sp. JEL0837]|nr:CSN-associated deubiquitinating enzyme Ubp12 [Blyttiomyces sp. JEL0837]
MSDINVSLLNVCPTSSDHIDLQLYILPDSTTAQSLYEHVAKQKLLDIDAFRFWTLDRPDGSTPVNVIARNDTRLVDISSHVRFGFETRNGDGEWQIKRKMEPMRVSADDDFDLPTVEEALMANGHSSGLNGIDGIYNASIANDADDILDSAPKAGLGSKTETKAEKMARIHVVGGGLALPLGSNSPPAPPAPPPSFKPTVTTTYGSRNSPSSSSWQSHRPVSTHSIGCTGLVNLGNTCFMNSALQCLSNTAPLTTFFLSDAWRAQLNTDNPLGMHGEVAEAYAHLVGQIWNVSDHRNASIPPRMFKSTIGRFNPTFVGYSQQDSQELLQFLLDGLHEDLNRIKKKPYIEAPDMDGMPEEEIAIKSWEMYRARNDSAIVDLFQGEYKSRVECVDCGKWSIKFDPYMFLSVPVPERREVSKEFFMVPFIAPGAEGTGRVRKVTFTVPRDSTILSLKQKVVDKMGWGPMRTNASGKTLRDSKRCMVVEVFQKKIYKVFDDWDRVAEIGGTDTVFIYELGEPDWDAFGTPLENREFSQVAHVPVYFSLAKSGSSSSSYSKSSYYYNNEALQDLFGFPIMIPVPADVGVVATVECEGFPWGTESELEEARSAPGFHQLPTQLRKILHELYMVKLGRVLYREAVRAVRRFSVVGLYAAVEGDGKEVDFGGEDLVKEVELREGPRRPVAVGSGWDSERVYGSAAADGSEVNGDDADAAVTSGIEVSMAPSLFEKLLPNERAAGEGSRLQQVEGISADGYVKGCPVAPVPRLFTLKYLQGSQEASASERASFYHHPTTRNVGAFYPYQYPKAKRIVKKAAASVDGAAATKTDDVDGAAVGQVSEDMDVEKQETDGVVQEDGLYGRGGSRKTMSWIGENVPVDEVEDGEIRMGEQKEDVVVYEAEPGAPGTFTFRHSFSMRGELLAVAEFEPAMASIVFGKSVFESRGSSLQGLFAPEDGEEESTSDKKTTTAPVPKHKKNITLQDCLNEFMKEEIMGDDDTWYCPRCKDHKKIKKKLDIWSVPETLVFHLKRFSNTGRGFRSMSANKIDALVEFPISGLDLSEVVLSHQRGIPTHNRSNLSSSAANSDAAGEGLIYDLYAVSNHFGGLGGGHYTAYAKNRLDDQWYNFDDSHVSKISEDGVMTDAAYLLFYQRRRANVKDNLANVIEEVKERLAKQPPQQHQQQQSSGPPSYFESISTYGPSRPIKSSNFYAAAPSPAASGVGSDDETESGLYGRFSRKRSSSQPGMPGLLDPEPIRSREPILPTTGSSNVGFDFGKRRYPDEGIDGTMEADPADIWSTRGTPVHDINLDDDLETLPGTSVAGVEEDVGPTYGPVDLSSGRTVSMMSATAGVTMDLDDDEISKI